MLKDTQYITKIITELGISTYLVWHAEITCKINRCKKITFQHILSRPRSMAVFLEWSRLHKLATPNRLQVDQTCTVGYIFYHIFIRRSFNKINQSDTSEMDAIVDRFKVIVPSHGVTHKWYFDHFSLDAPFWFKIWDLLLRCHQYWGWSWDKSQLTLRNRFWDKSQITLPNQYWNKYQLTLPYQERGFHTIIFSSTHRILGESCLLVYSAYSKWGYFIPSSQHIAADSWPHYHLIYPLNIGWYFNLLLQQVCLSSLAI